LFFLTPANGSPVDTFIDVHWIALSEKAKETQILLIQTEAAIEDLKRDTAETNNVVDISVALKFIQIFKNGAFDALPVAAQAEILKERVRRIVVRENGVYVEVFGKKPEPVLNLLSGEGNGRQGNSESRSNLSIIRTVSKVVRSGR
jgi:hypothetical protein